MAEPYRSSLRTARAKHGLMWLYKNDGKSFAEIGRMFKCSSSAVRLGVRRIERDLAGACWRLNRRLNKDFRNVEGLGRDSQGWFTSLLKTQIPPHK